MRRLLGVVLGLLVAGLAMAAEQAATAPDPVAWVAARWLQIVTAVAAGLVVYQVRRIDQKFGVLFAWKDKIDRVVGVHDQVWDHGEGCGPLWVHHRADGKSALHFRATDHPGLCEKCQALRGHVVNP